MKAVCVKIAHCTNSIVMGHTRGLAVSIQPNNNAFKAGY